MVSKVVLEQSFQVRNQGFEIYQWVLVVITTAIANAQQNKVAGREVSLC